MSVGHFTINGKITLILHILLYMTLTIYDNMTLTKYQYNQHKNHMNVDDVMGAEGFLPLSMIVLVKATPFCFSLLDVDRSRCVLFLYGMNKTL